MLSVITPPADVMKSWHVDTGTKLGQHPYQVYELKNHRQRHAYDQPQRQREGHAVLVHGVEEHQIQQRERKRRKKPVQQVHQGRKRPKLDAHVVGHHHAELVHQPRHQREQQQKEWKWVHDEVAKVGGAHSDVADPELRGAHEQVAVVGQDDVDHDRDHGVAGEGDGVIEQRQRFEWQALRQHGQERPGEKHVSDHQVPVRVLVQRKQATGQEEHDLSGDDEEGDERHPGDGNLSREVTPGHDDLLSSLYIDLEDVAGSFNTDAASLALCNPDDMAVGLMAAASCLGSWGSAGMVEHRELDRLQSAWARRDLEFIPDPSVKMPAASCFSTEDLAAFAHLGWNVADDEFAKTTRTSVVYGKPLEVCTWVCPVQDCKIFVNHAYEFRNHLAWHLEQGILECESCGSVYHQTQLYTNHVAKAHGRSISCTLPRAAMWKTAHFLEGLSGKLSGSEITMRIASALQPSAGPQ